MTSFGDMMRVPGSNGSFFDAKAAGTDIRMVYSPLDCAEDRPAEPGQAGRVHGDRVRDDRAVHRDDVLRAAAEGSTNFSVFCNHVTIIPAIKAILDSPDLRLDGFIGPGHVSTVIGCRPYEFIARDYGKPVVVRRVRAAGHPAVDLHADAAAVARAAPRSRTSTRGWCPGTATRWRSKVIDEIDGAAALLRVARARLHLALGAAGSGRSTRRSTPSCCSRCPGCGSPTRRPASAARCSRACSSRGSARCSAPRARRRRPIGTCMVSPEGACAAYYNFGRFTREPGRRRRARS